ncbi:DUF4352 domain-containing protein [Paenibacillus sp. EKM202P]|uniref:DUF4352 domain-containing protein n=1 Tax=unclassified Paenibacillus TaxID=185978 RepID=UPI0013ECC9A6|nr:MULTISPECIES: DUF4352 domain-containing protein [unclassified Paenibacillus]KAF6568405.1 DUF4352 domain-containing protein [Paenibacillus sp. EKM202P]KAF6570805.1 DUF4352 domain-containing protein [Paenibacillus sp. EKM207P]
MKNKTFFSLLCAFIISIMGLTACGVSSSKDHSLLSKEEFEQMYVNADQFEDRSINFYGQITYGPKENRNGIYVQVNADPKNNEKNTFVYGDSFSSFSNVKENDFIHVTGTVIEKYRYRTTHGNYTSAPAISANKIEKSMFIDPTLSTIEVNKSVKQKGYIMTLQKVEFAEEETRLYMAIENRSTSTINYYDFYTKLVQGNKQYEPTFDRVSYTYPELQSEILPGVKTEGILTFSKIDSSKDLTLIAKGSSEELEYNPFKFKISKK